MQRAHGIGGQQDLPIPLELAISGAVAALVISFTVLAVAWRSPRYGKDDAGRRPNFAWIAPTFGMVVFLLAVASALFGKASSINPFFGIFYVWLWVGIVPASLLFGQFYRAISPVRTIHRLLARLARTDPSRGSYTYPERLGVWPAAVGLYAFVWMELVNPHMAELSQARTWAAVYVGVMIVGGAVFGERFFERADPFEVYSSLVARLSPWHRQEGRLRVRNPLVNLDAVVAVPGLAAVVGVLFGSTGFDSFSDTQVWTNFTLKHEVAPVVWNNLCLLAFCVGTTALFVVACLLAGRGVDGSGLRRRDLPNVFAHSIVPIIVGYMVAHYLTYFLEVGSRTIAHAGDPFSQGWNLLYLADFPLVVELSYHPTLLASIKVLAVVVGHVLAAVAAHERALQILPKERQLTGQLPLLVVMVGFTAGGLFLLFAP